MAAGHPVLSRKLSRCKLPSGKSDIRRMKPSTMDHQLSSQSLSANSLKMMWGVTLLRSRRRLRKKGAGCLACPSAAGPRPESRPAPKPRTHTKLWGAQPHQKDASSWEKICHTSKPCAWQLSELLPLGHSATAWPMPLSCCQTQRRDQHSWSGEAWPLPP